MAPLHQIISEFPAPASSLRFFKFDRITHLRFAVVDPSLVTSPLPCIELQRRLSPGLDAYSP